MKITISEDIVRETFTVQMPELLSEARTVIYEGVHDVKARFFWNDNGRRTAWDYNGKKSFSKKNAEISIVEVRREYADPMYSMTFWAAVINGEQKFTDVVRYSICGKNMHLKIDVGWG